jgi:hypothetical protein
LINPIDGTCSNCNSLPNTKKDNDYSKDSKTKTCTCAASYSLINGACTCDPKKK